MVLATSTPIEALDLPSFPGAPSFTKVFSIELYLSNQCVPAKIQQLDRKNQKSPKRNNQKLHSLPQESWILLLPPPELAYNSFPIQWHHYLSDQRYIYCSSQLWGTSTGRHYHYCQMLNDQFTDSTWLILWRGAIQQRPSSPNTWICYWMLRMIRIHWYNVTCPTRRLNHCL
jgi:hypothetical protein